MPSPRSRYRSGSAPDYSHAFHAGNVGDVWKHCVLSEVLREVARVAEVVSYIDTHAGEGRYGLAPTGEWSEGIGRLWDVVIAPDRAPALSRYLSWCRALGPQEERPTTYPGSPLLAREVLGPYARLVLYEQDERSCERLRRNVDAGERTRVRHADGPAALIDELREAEPTSDAAVALVDPPYGEKADWNELPKLIAAAAAATTQACLLLWYPVKSLTRPNAMMAELEKAGVHGTTAELITTPLSHQRRRLNGSGVIFVRPPPAALEGIAAAAAAIGPLCATRESVWSFRMLGW